MHPITIDLPHTLDREEVRRRMNAGITKLPSHIPGGVAEVHADWLTNDQMKVNVKAMGQDITTTLDVQERHVRLTVLLPGLLALAAGPIEAVIRRSGEKLLLENPDASKS